MTRHAAILVLLAVLPVTAVFLALSCCSIAQEGTRRQHPRARPPKFTKQEVTRVFFEDLFSHLVGPRPESARSVTVADRGEPDTKPSTSTPVADGDARRWSHIVRAHDYRG